MTKHPKGTELQTHPTTYENLAEHHKSVNDKLVMFAYLKPTTWKRAREFCMNQGMKDGTFRNIDYKLKDLSVIREVKDTRARGGSHVTSALSRRREILIRQIETATKAEDVLRPPAGYMLRSIRGRWTLLERLFWYVFDCIEKNDDMFRGLRIDLDPVKCFREGELFKMQSQDMVSWLWKIENWLADVHPDE